MQLRQCFTCRAQRWRVSSCASMVRMWRGKQRRGRAACHDLAVQNGVGGHKRLAPLETYSCCSTGGKSCCTGYKGAYMPVGYKGAYIPVGNKGAYMPVGCPKWTITRRLCGHRTSYVTNRALCSANMHEWNHL
eukprot:353426-Chlamydomonas_euryale.AAC.3